VALLTAGVDTQDDRFEITITGWGEMKNRGRSRMTLFMVTLRRKNPGSDWMHT
jgi:phage terminase large subunit GpA-like protein